MCSIFDYVSICLSLVYSRCYHQGFQIFLVVCMCEVYRNDSTLTHVGKAMLESRGYGAIVLSNLAKVAQDFGPKFGSELLADAYKLRRYVDSQANYFSFKYIASQNNTGGQVLRFPEYAKTFNEECERR